MKNWVSGKQTFRKKNFGEIGIRENRLSGGDSGKRILGDWIWDFWLFTAQNPEVDIPNVNNPNDKIPNVKIMNVKIPKAIRQKIPKIKVYYFGLPKNSKKISKI